MTGNVLQHPYIAQLSNIQKSIPLSRINSNSPPPESLPWFLFLIIFSSFSSATKELCSTIVELFQLQVIILSWPRCFHHLKGACWGPRPCFSFYTCPLSHIIATPISGSNNIGITSIMCPVGMLLLPDMCGSHSYCILWHQLLIKKKKSFHLLVRR